MSGKSWFSRIYGVTTYIHTWIRKASWHRRKLQYRSRLIEDCTILTSLDHVFLSCKVGMSGQCAVPSYSYLWLRSHIIGIYFYTSNGWSKLLHGDLLNNRISTDRDLNGPRFPFGVSQQNKKKKPQSGWKIIIVCWPIEHSWIAFDLGNEIPKASDISINNNGNNNDKPIYYCPDSTEGSGDNVASHGCTTFYTVPRFGGAFPGTSSNLNWGMTGARLLLLAASFAIFHTQVAGRRHHF